MEILSEPDYKIEEVTDYSFLMDEPTGELNVTLRPGDTIERVTEQFDGQSEPAFMIQRGSRKYVLYVRNMHGYSFQNRTERTVLPKKRVPSPSAVVENSSKPRLSIDWGNDSTAVPNLTVEP